MVFKGRIIGILLVIANTFIWILHQFYQHHERGCFVFEISFSILSLPLFWWIGRSFDYYKMTTKELKTSNERFQTIFEKAGIGISLIDGTGKPIVVNPKLQEFLGYSEEELKHMTFSEFSNPEDSKVNFELLTQLINREIDSYQLEKRYIRKDGITVWGHVTSSLFPNQDGDLSYVIGMVIDITDRKVAEKKLLEVNQKLEYLSNIDGLTGIANRRYFDKHLLQEWIKAKSYAAPLSLIMFDIDYFKKFNDTYGHLVGDACLKKIAEILNQMMEITKCFPARYGGEEFAIILPGTTIKKATQIAEQIRTAVEGLLLPHALSDVFPYVTISVGLASLIPNSQTSPEDLIANADTALYDAKMEGRNRICYRPVDKEFLNLSLL
ncbi:MAG: sensor-containing diguanylate cyclase [Bacillus sp. (in: firmicutes)]|nr:sensor-containing diguanylate cyclase [Bacillus sp. (in: firmicutes)]